MEEDNLIRILKNRLKYLYSLIESVEVFQYLPDETEKGWPKIINSEHAKEQIVELESAIEKLKEGEGEKKEARVAEDWIRGEPYE